MSLKSDPRSLNPFLRFGAMAVTVGVVVGFADMPYGYYMLLRLVLCAFSVYILFGAGFVLADWEW